MRDDGVTKDLSDQKKEMLFMECALQISMNKDFDNEFGMLKYTFSEREKISIFCFSFGHYIIIVFSEPNIDCPTTGQNISEIIGASSVDFELYSVNRTSKF